jgi:hypothetical protein
MEDASTAKYPTHNVGYARKDKEALEATFLPSLFALLG